MQIAHGTMFNTISKAINFCIPGYQHTGCHMGTDIKFAMTALALRNPMSWERCHYFPETCTFMYNISENLIVKFQKWYWGRENRPQKLKTHEKLKVLNKEKSVFIPILNPL